MNSSLGFLFKIKESSSQAYKLYRLALLRVLTNFIQLKASRCLLVEVSRVMVVVTRDCSRKTSINKLFLYKSLNVQMERQRKSVIRDEAATKAHFIANGNFYRCCCCCSQKTSSLRTFVQQGYGLHSINVLGAGELMLHMLYN